LGSSQDQSPVGKPPEELALGVPDQKFSATARSAKTKTCPSKPNNHAILIFVVAARRPKTRFSVDGAVKVVVEKEKILVCFEAPGCSLGGARG